MKKLIFAMLLAFSVSSVFAQTEGSAAAGAGASAGAVTATATATALVGAGVILAGIVAAGANNDATATHH